MNEKTNISLQLLLLNDLFSANIIDKEIYDRATEKIETFTYNSRAA